MLGDEAARMKAKSVFITGAATGIGMGLAQKLDDLGWTVFAGINKTAPDDLLRRASDRLRLVCVNIADDAQVEQAADTVRDGVGARGLSLLINNAAVTGAPGPIECVDIAEFKDLMEVNFWGPLRVTQAFLPLLRQYGRGARIINVTSASIYFTIPIGGSYTISKHALTALTDHLRMEMAPFGIEVTALEAGGVTTRMTSNGWTPEAEAKLWNSMPGSLRQQYEAAFTYPGKGLEAGFKFESPETYADKVYKRIICAKSLRPRYTLGIGVGILPWMHRLLSRRQLERVSRKLLRVKAAP